MDARPMNLAIVIGWTAHSFRAMRNDLLWRSTMKTDRTTHIEEIINNINLDLIKRTPAPIISYMVKITGKNAWQVKEAINAIRRRRCLKVKRVDKPSLGNGNPIIQACLKDKLLRASRRQGPVSKAIGKFAVRNLPMIGAGLLFGTPGPFFASKNKNLSNTIIDDEGCLGHMLMLTCDSVTVIVGDVIDSVKAKIKADHWRSLDSMRGAIVKEETADRDSYTCWITRLVEKYSVCKVILLTSGSWNGSPESFKKYGLDVNFRAPSIRLTEMYQNLHILALRRIGEYAFDAVYVHNGFEKVIYNSKAGVARAGEQLSSVAGGQE